MENIVFLLTVLLRTGVSMFFSGILGSSALLLLLSVVSLDCCFGCCLSGCALPELLGSAVHAVATKLTTSCTVTAPVLHEVSSNASLLLVLLLVFWRFCLLLASLLPSRLLRFGGVDDGGVDPLGTLCCFCHGWDDSFQRCCHVVFLLCCVFFLWLSRSVWLSG